MSKLKKRIILICVTLAVLLTCTVAMFALAEESVPMPKNKGLARMRKDIYQMYADGVISKDAFDRYAKSFELCNDINLERTASQYYHSVKVTKDKGNQGCNKTTVQFNDLGGLKVDLYGSAAYNEEMVNNFDLRQKFHLTTISYGRGWYSMGMGWGYEADDLININSFFSDDIETILSGKKLYKGGIYNGRYAWHIDTDGYATAKNFSYQLLDKSKAGKNGWTAELEESGDHGADGSTVYQLVIRDKNGDQFRPANESISYADLATLQLQVTMQSTDTLSDGKTYVIPARAVEIREKVTSDKGYPSAIVFEFYGDEWLNMEDQVTITDIKAVQVMPENGDAPSYDIWDMYAKEDLTELFGLSSSTPVTDFAGNEILWEGTSITKKGSMIMDRKEATIVALEVDFSNFTSPAGSTEAGYAESFTGPYDYVFWPTLITNEEMYFNPEAKGKVALQWNLRDENGDPVVSVLERYYNYTDRNGIVYTELVFDTVFITYGMTPQGEQILVEKILNEHLLQDRVGNNNLTNEILMTGDKNTSIWPNQVSFLDTMPPSVVMQDVVVREKTSVESGKIESIQITVPFKVTDFDPGEGLMRSTASGTTAYLRLSNPVDGQEIAYKYAVSYTTDFPDANAKWSSGNLGRDNHSGYAAFGVADESKNIYLHMELSNLTNYEISETNGLNLELRLQDMANNSAKVTRNIPITGVDNVGPEVFLSDRRIQLNNDGQSVDFSASIHITDTNGISLVEYRFADSMEDTSTAYNVLYQKAVSEEYLRSWNGSASNSFASTSLVEKILQIRVYDKNNNYTVTSMPFSADLNKVITNYDLTEDIYLPSSQSGIVISEPIFNGELSETAATRVTVVVPTQDENGLLGQDIYFRVIPAKDAVNGVQALDPNAVWYKAGNCVQHNTLNYYIYHNVEAVVGQPAWVDHYGEMDVYVASSNLSMSNILEDGTLILEPGYSNNSSTDPTYSQSKLGTVSYAGKIDDVYTMSYNTSSTRILLADATGTEVPAIIKWENDDHSNNKELYRYAKFNQSIAGVRVGVTFRNESVREWGADGIDFTESYAVLVRADADGTLTRDDEGNYDEVTARLPLSQSLTQTLTVPDSPAEGESFTSGVYTWVVHIAQKGGGTSDFAAGKVYLILDNAAVPENFGILEHTTKIQVVDGYWEPQYVTSTKTPEDGKNTLDVVNIGIAKPTALMDEEYDEATDTTSYTFTEKLEQVQIDGYTAYLKGVANSSAFGSSYQSEHFGSFTITADMTDSGYGTFLGQEIGTVQGIRFWNKANTPDYTKITYVKKDESYRDFGIRGVTADFSQTGAIAKLDVSFNVAWYMTEDNPLYESAEALKADLPDGRFGVINGENTICYQLLMDNGKESPIYQFKLNLVEEVPMVTVDFDYGPYYNNITEDENVHYTEYADLYFGNMFSLYSGLEVYHVQFQEEGTGGLYEFYSVTRLTDEELTNGYRIYEGCSGYNHSYYYDSFGYQGTSITGMLDCTGSESFFVVLDNSGNAVTVYPMDSSSRSYDESSPDLYAKNHVFTKFTPEELRYVEEQKDGLHFVQPIYADTNYAGEPVEAGVDFYTASRVDFRLDADRASTEEEKEALWVITETDNDSISVPNASGLASLYSRYTGEIGFAVPYDPTKAETEYITHTAEVILYGMPDSTGQPNFVWEDSVTFEALNTKPAIAKVETLSGCIAITYNTAVITDEGVSNVCCIPVTDDSIYGSSYTHTFKDLFGNEYTESFIVPEKVSDPTITYSTTELTEGPVIVTVISALYDSMTLHDEPNSVSYEGSMTDTLTITVTENCEFAIYNLDYYAYEYTLLGYVDVNNIIPSFEVDPYIGWDYRKTDIVNGNVVYGNVTAALLDRNGQALLDPATGAPAVFVFTPEGPTEYTFTGCYSELTNTPVPDITAKLEVTLQPEPITEADTFAPDVDVVAYLSNSSGAKPANMVYRQDSGRFAMYDYAFDYRLPEDEVYYSDLNEMIANMGWSKSYMFHLDVHDDSRIKLILSKDIQESGITYNTAGETIDGVNLVGRTLQITKNCEFALYIVDEENNITALHFRVSNLSDAPVPELALVNSLTADGKPAVRVYLLPPQIANYENLMITNIGKLTDQEAYDGIVSDYSGLDYMLYSTSGTYSINYSYEVPGYQDAFEGTLTAVVSVPELITPTVKNFFWSANYFNKTTNQDISLNLKLNIPVYSISAVYSVGETDYLISNQDLEAYGIHIGYFQDDCTITFQQNTDTLEKQLLEQWGAGTIRLKMTEMTSAKDIVGSIGYYVLPAVKTIDRTAPALTDVQIEIDQTNYKSAEITLTLDETALSSDGSQKGTEFKYTVRENKTFTYTFVDEAGNRSSFDVEVKDLLTEALKITLSTGASEESIITDPSTYRAEIGQTLYARVNRDAAIYIYGEGDAESRIPAAKNTWVAVQVTENSMGMHPSVVARDNFGNVAIVQLEYIPIRDVTAPAAFLHRDLISVSATATEQEIEAVLLDNILYSDDTTAMKDLLVEIDYAKIVSGKTVVTYTITDEEGNTTVRQCWLRIRSGLEPVIHVNGQLVEDGAFLYISDSNDLEITVAYDSDVVEPYKLVYEKGDLRSWAKLKDGTWLTAGYEERNSQTYKIADLGDGWYSFALTTQGMEIYYFQVHIGSVS